MTTAHGRAWTGHSKSPLGHLPALPSALPPTALSEAFLSLDASGRSFPPHSSKPLQVYSSGLTPPHPPKPSAAPGQAIPSQLRAGRLEQLRAGRLEPLVQCFRGRSTTPFCLVWILNPPGRGENQVVLLLHPHRGAGTAEALTWWSRNNA